MPNANDGLSSDSRFSTIKDVDKKDLDHYDEKLPPGPQREEELGKPSKK